MTLPQPRIIAPCYPDEKRGCEGLMDEEIRRQLAFADKLEHCHPDGKHHALPAHLQRQKDALLDELAKRSPQERWDEI
jgi:hypothetical protein